MRALCRSLVRSGVAVAATAAVLLGAGPAVAEPATPAAYPAASSATRATGLGFDACSAPSVASMKAWRASPYRTVNTYFGGANRYCSQPALNAGWVTSVSQQGWRILPTYMGYQPSCTTSSKKFRYTATDATSRGDADARDALAAAKSLGLLPGSALYGDVEPYSTSSSTCTTAVRRYTSAWTKRLHAAGYLAGIYAAQNSGARQLAQSYTSTAYARPDALWLSRWDGSTSLTGWSTVPNADWAGHQRIKQYRGDHTETWGGATINIDSDSLDAPVATVAYPYQVTSSTSLVGHRGPATTAAVTATYASGSTVRVLCQTTGTKVGGSAVWNRLADGSWVTDRYVSTPSDTGFSAPLPRCTYPGQVTAGSLTARTGPGTSYSAKGANLPAGALAWVACQRAGSKVGTTSVWDRLEDGRWVSDYYVSNASQTGYSPAVPRC